VTHQTHCLLFYPPLHPSCTSPPLGCSPFESNCSCSCLVGGVRGCQKTWQKVYEGRWMVGSTARACCSGVRGLAAGGGKVLAAGDKDKVVLLNKKIVMELVSKRKLTSNSLYPCITDPFLALSTIRTSVALNECRRW
jgi:hypothetical protein